MTQKVLYAVKQNKTTNQPIIQYFLSNILLIYFPLHQMM